MAVRYIFGVQEDTQTAHLASARAFSWINPISAVHWSCNAAQTNNQRPRTSATVQETPASSVAWFSFVISTCRSAAWRVQHLDTPLKAAARVVPHNFPWANIGSWAKQLLYVSWANIGPKSVCESESYSDRLTFLAFIACCTSLSRSSSWVFNSAIRFWSCCGKSVRNQAGHRHSQLIHSHIDWPTAA